MPFIIALLSALRSQQVPYPLGSGYETQNADTSGHYQYSHVNADIVTGISLMLLLWHFDLHGDFPTWYISTFNIPYVILSVMPKLNKRKNNPPSSSYCISHLCICQKAVLPDTRGSFRIPSGLYDVTGSFGDHPLYQRSRDRYTLHQDLQRSPQRNQTGDVCTLHDHVPDGTRPAVLDQFHTGLFFKHRDHVRIQIFAPVVYDQLIVSSCDSVFGAVINPPAVMTMAIPTGMIRLQTIRLTFCHFLCLSEAVRFDFFDSGVKLIKNSRTSTVRNMIVESAYISGLIPLRTSL